MKGQRASAHSTHFVMVNNKRGVIIDEIAEEDRIDTENIRTLVGQADGKTIRDIGARMESFHSRLQVILLHNTVPLDVQQEYIANRVTTVSSDVRFYKDDHRETLCRFPKGLVRGRDHFDDIKKEKWVYVNSQTEEFNNEMFVQEHVDDQQNWKGGHQSELFTMLAHYAHVMASLQRKKKRFEDPPVVKADHRSFFTANDEVRAVLDEQFVPVEPDGPHGKLRESLTSVYNAYKEKVVKGQKALTRNAFKNKLVAMQWMPKVSQGYGEMTYLVFRARLEDSAAPFEEKSSQGDQKFTEACLNKLFSYYNFFSKLQTTDKIPFPAYTKSWFVENQCIPYFKTLAKRPKKETNCMSLSLKGSSLQ